MKTNAAQCSICKDIMVSVTVHDYRSCSCKSTFVDGGDEYQRVGGDAAVAIDNLEALKIALRRAGTVPCVVTMIEQLCINSARIRELEVQIDRLSDILEAHGYG